LAGGVSRPITLIGSACLTIGGFDHRPVGEADHGGECGRHDADHGPHLRHARGAYASFPICRRRSITFEMRSSTFRER